MSPEPRARRHRRRDDRHDEALRRLRGARRRLDEDRGRRLPRAARRERRGQVDAGEMHHGLLRARPPAASWSTAARSAITNPKGAQARGLGMVYQHFTLVPVADRRREPRHRPAPTCRRSIDWRAERARARRVHGPDAVPAEPRRPVAELAAGEKQKLEILKQLYLKAALPDPRRADLGAHARRRPRRCSACCAPWRIGGELTVLMISHKFREVEAFARSVSVLRRGTPRRAAARSANSSATTWRR